MLEAQKLHTPVCRFDWIIVQGIWKELGLSLQVVSPSAAVPRSLLDMSGVHREGRLAEPVVPLHGVLETLRSTTLHRESLPSAD